MDVPAYVGVVAGFALLFLASRVVAGRPGFIGETFYRDRGSRWPNGIQEDDDFAWRWRPGQRRIDPPVPRLAPVLPDPEESPPAVAVETVRGRVHGR